MSHHKTLHVGIFEEILCDAQVADLIDDMPHDKVVELYVVDKNVKAISKSDSVLLQVMEINATNYKVKVTRVKLQQMWRRQTKWYLQMC